MIEIEFVRDWKCCWHVGDRREVQDHFAYAMIEAGVAKRIEKLGEKLGEKFGKAVQAPARHKMMTQPVKGK